ncbi:uncharacterized protein BX663DRAFT_517830 [Cokeromyces recurvatus]|uniref:uncharacterized protein n=1 Tax=Cokeromyces recurvatus TaxID=90255 RepID=UPI002221027B|nr:uncharacterized protein BX663DRAFT_517830 [Cokeromyces recurvatus]KAI7900495.1 hypothetical protein BX663DRAFT_517830 [Cokeromyces recurvatus]
MTSNMDASFSQKVIEKPKRKQVKNACVNCQKACKKCDDGRPCKRCIKLGLTATCKDSDRKERKKGVKRGPYKKRQAYLKDKPEQQPLLLPILYEQQQSLLNLNNDSIKNQSSIFNSSISRHQQSPILTTNNSMIHLDEASSDETLHYFTYGLLDHRQQNITTGYHHHDIIIPLPSFDSSLNDPSSLSPIDYHPSMTNLQQKESILPLYNNNSNNDIHNLTTTTTFINEEEENNINWLIETSSFSNFDLNSTLHNHFWSFPPC